MNNSLKKAIMLSVVLAIFFSGRASECKSSRIEGDKDDIIKNSKIIFQEEDFQLKNGTGYKTYSPDSYVKNTVTIQNIIWNPIEGISSNHAIITLRNDPGGSGVFYYIALARQKEEHFFEINSDVFLGDRIEIEKIKAKNNKIYCEILTRKQSDSFANKPSIKKTIVIEYDNKKNKLHTAK